MLDIISQIDYMLVSNKKLRILIVSGFFFVFLCLYFFVTYIRFQEGHFHLDAVQNVVMSFKDDSLSFSKNKFFKDLMALHVFLFMYPLSYIFKYIFNSNPLGLYMLTAFLLWNSSFIIYLISRRLIESVTLSILLSFIFLLNPFVFRLLGFFGPEFFFIPIFLLGFYFLVSNKPIFAIITFVISLASRETESFYLVTFCISLFLIHKYRKISIVLFICTVIIMIFQFGYWYPHLNPTSHGSSMLNQVYGRFGDSPLSIIIGVIKYIFLSPFSFLSEIFGYNEKRLYLLLLFLITGGTLFFNPFSLILIPHLLMVFLTNPGYSIRWKMLGITDCTILPILFVILLTSINYINTQTTFLRFAKWRKQISLIAIFISLMLSLAVVPRTIVRNTVQFFKGQYNHSYKETLTEIPVGSRIVMPYIYIAYAPSMGHHIRNIYPFLSSDNKEFNNELNQADMVILDNVYPLSDESYYKFKEHFLKSSQWRIIYQNNTVFVFSRIT